VTDWNAPLPRSIRPPGHIELVSLADARAYVAALPAGMEQRPTWQAAARLLREAAESGSPDAINAATQQIETALSVSRELELRRQESTARLAARRTAAAMAAKPAPRSP
jgi:hypothetical protein